ncbi:MAG: PilZ domain-containing protein [Candidatus Electrothrix sp. AUS4]|nr:PilZ domain-containing protein [Candidatus Electrothrix sp. AUS4]
MDGLNNRQFTRMNIRWAVQIDFESTQYRYFVENLSLSGFLVKEECGLAVGNICKITIKESALYTDAVIRAAGLIVRKTEQMTAFEFIGMKLSSYCYLQASLLTKAIKPSNLVNEIVKSDSFNFDGDLVFNSACNLNKKEILILLDDLGL